MKIILVIGIILILISLGSAWFFLMQNKGKNGGKSSNTWRALAIRVGLSITLFVLLLAAYQLGWISPTGILY